MTIVARPDSTNLLAVFTDEGELLLGYALGTDAGRSVYNGIKNHMITGVDFQRVFNYFCERAREKYGRSRNLSSDQIKVLVLKMIEKAANDFIQDELLSS